MIGKYDTGLNTFIFLTKIFPISLQDAAHTLPTSGYPNQTYYVTSFSCNELSISLLLCI